MKEECPVCGEDAGDVQATEQEDETGVDFTVASGGEVIGMREMLVIEYEFTPCGHTAVGTVPYPEDR